MEKPRYKLIKFSRKTDGPVVHEVYHRGRELVNSTYHLAPTYQLSRNLTASMPGRVECVEPSPHYAYAYTV